MSEDKEVGRRSSQDQIAKRDMAKEEAAAKAAAAKEVKEEECRQTPRAGDEQGARKSRIPRPSDAGLRKTEITISKEDFDTY